MASITRVFERRRPSADAFEVAIKAVKVAQDPKALSELSPRERRHVDQVAKAVRNGSVWSQPGASSGTVAQMARARPVSAEVIARQAHMALGPSSNITPIDIETALRQQGIDWVEPFAPGKPLTPYYGYNRRPRERNYQVGRNISTETRPGRIPFDTLRHLIQSYDVASICYRHAIQDLRSMRIRFEVMDGYEENCVKEIAAAKEFWRRPDRKLDEDGKVIPNSGLTTRNWICKHATDVWRFDAGTMYRRRDRAGRLISLPIADGTLFAPMLDYFGDTPTGQAPAFQQFIQGIPWDWLRAEDLVYEPMWPHTEDPYGVAPIETVLVNANTDIRLQTYFLQFFTTGTVPEAFAIAPEDQSDPDALADWQEDYNDWTYGDQSERWGLRWLPYGTELEFYKPQQFDPDVAEYVMRRTVAAFMMVPHDLGFTADVNRSTADTQMDTQFRINSLPHVAYYEDIMDAVTQGDLGLPVQMRFDTGREKEDRLMEAQSHQIYVSIGAESPDEVRDKVLGYAVNPEEKVPRFFDSTRLGPIPIAYLLATAGDVDPLTGAPRPGTVQAKELILPGTPGPDPAASDGTPPAYSNAAMHDAKTRRQQGANAGPKVSGPLGPGPLSPAPPSALPSASSPAGTTGPAPRRLAGGAAPSRETSGYGNRRLEQSRKEATAGVGIGTGIAGVSTDGDSDDDDDESMADLGRWRAQSRKRVAKGLSPRPFLDSAIPPTVYGSLWAHLQGANSREQVDVAFAKATAGVHSKRSGMVSLDVPPGLIPVMDGGVPDQHITVVFIGSDVDDALFARVCDAAQAVAGAQPGPMTGTLGGLGTFEPSESSDWLVPAWATPQIPGIEDLRAPLEGFNASQHKDFHPHMTLAYLDPDEPLPDPLPPTSVTFTHLSVHRGDEVQRFPFGVAKAKRPEVAGLALVAQDSGRVLMVQRGNKDDGDGARWEFAAGHLDEGEDALHAAIREWQEETGATLPKDAEQVGTWVSENGEFQGFVYRTGSEDDVDLGKPDGDEIAAAAWWDIDDLDDSDIRDKVRENLDRSEPILERAEKADGIIDYSGRLILSEPLRAGDTVVVERRGISERYSTEDVDDLEKEATRPKVLRPGPGGHREEELVQFYSPLVTAALTEMVDPMAVAKRFAGLSGVEARKGAIRDLTASIVSAVASGTLSLAGLKDVLRAMWADAWVAGAKDGVDHGVAVPPSDSLVQAVNEVDWHVWAPGHAEGWPPGADDVEQQLGRLITGISETTRDQIVTAIENFVAGRIAPVPWTDADVADLAAQIGAMLDDPARGHLIARTEVNRAMTNAAIDVFKRAGYAMFDLLTHINACEKCKAIARANPHPIADVAAMPPIHPQCRCSTAPAR